MNTKIREEIGCEDSTYVEPPQERIKIETILQRLGSFCILDTPMLEQEVQYQSAYVEELGFYICQFTRKLDSVKQKYNKVRAELSLTIRFEFSESKVKATEGLIECRIDADESINLLLDRISLWKSRVAYLEVLQTALIDKRKALDKLYSNNNSSV